MHVWFLYRALSDPVGNSHSPHMSLTQISWRAGSHACSCSDFDFWKCHIASWRELFFAARNHEQVDLFHGPILSGYFISISPYDLDVWTAALRLFAAIVTLHSRVALLCLQCQPIGRQIAIATISRRAEKHHSSVAWTMSARARNANKQQTRTSTGAVFCPQAQQHSLCMPLLSSFSMTSDKLIAPEIIQARNLHFPSMHFSAKTPFVIHHSHA